MKNEIYTFKINDNKKYDIAKCFIKHLKRTNLFEIEAICDRVEHNVCQYLDTIFAEVKSDNTDISYKTFKKELDEIVKKV